MSSSSRKSSSGKSSSRKSSSGKSVAKDKKSSVLDSSESTSKKPSTDTKQSDSLGAKDSSFPSQAPDDQTSNNRGGFFISFFFSLSTILIMVLTLMVFRPEIESYLRGTLGLPNNFQQQQESISKKIEREVALLDKKYQSKTNSIEKKFQDLHTENQQLESSLLVLHEDISDYQDQHSGSIIGGEKKISQLLADFRAIHRSLQRTNADILRLHVISGLPFRAQLNNLDLSGLEEARIPSESLNMLKSRQDVGFSSYRSLYDGLKDLSICRTSEEIESVLLKASSRETSKEDIKEDDSVASDSGQEQGWYDYMSSLFINSLSKLVRVRPLSQDSPSDKSSDSGQDQECLAWQQQILSILVAPTMDSDARQRVFAFLKDSPKTKTSELQDWISELSLSMQAELSVNRIIEQISSSS